MFEVTEKIKNENLKRIIDCMFTGEIESDKAKLKELAEIKLKLDCNYTGTKNRVARMIASFKKSEDYKKAGSNAEQRDAWLALQLDKEAENDKLQEYNFYWRAINTVERYNKTVLALDGKMMLDEKTEFITSRH